MSRVLLLFLPVILLLNSCKSQNEEVDSEITLDSIAEDFVKLSLEVGLYDEDYIDAYHGPEKWQQEVQEKKLEAFPYEEIVWKASHLLHELEDLDRKGFEPIEEQRFRFLAKMLIAAKTKIDMIAGKRFSFDEESRALYDAVAPNHDAAYFEKILQELEKLLPGKGDVAQRYMEFSKNFIIPKEKLDTVFKAAILEARNRTLKYIDLPENESFRLEYVTDKTWSGYNWYQGNGFSLIQINTDFPIYIERAIDLASHEGYPGHHVYNAMLEKTLLKDRGWLEFSVFPLFSPQSLIAEGSANYGIDMAFPGDDRIKFEKAVLYPLAGLDTALVDLYYDIQKLRSELDYAGNEAARDYLNGDITREEAAGWLIKYNLYSEDRALQRTRFIDQYRSYVINYNLGKDLVKNYVINQGGTEENPERRWELFTEILTTPRTASNIFGAN